MVTYETIIVTAPVLTEDDERVLVDGFADIVTDGGGTFFARDRMGRRRLAYPIRKFDDGVYTRFLYDAESAVPTELERRVKLSDKVLRWMTVKLEKQWADDAKKEAEREAQAKIEAEAKAAEEAAQAEAEAKAKAEAGARAPRPTRLQAMPPRLPRRAPPQPRPPKPPTFEKESNDG